MTQHRNSIVTLAELFELAVGIEPNLSRLSRRTEVSRATLYRIKNGTPEHSVNFETYGKLARFALEGK